MKVIERMKGSYRVEHDGLRYDVPHDVMNQYRTGLLDIDELMIQSLPVSIPWGEFIQIKVTPEVIERELHRHGVHTLEDLSKSMAAARGAIQKAVGISPSTIYRQASTRQQVK